MTLDSIIIGEKYFNLKKGDQILIVDKTTEEYYHHHNSHPGVRYCIEFSHVKQETHLILGILNETLDRLMSKSTKLPIVFPTGEYLQKTEPFNSFNEDKNVSSWEREKGNIKIPLSGMSDNKIYLNKKPIRKELKHKEGTFILTGDEVPKYFIQQDKSNVFYDSKVDLSYKIAIEMLRQELPLAYKEAFDKGLNIRALEIYHLIRKLEGGADSLEAEIEYARNISKMPKTGIIEGDEVFFKLDNYPKKQKVIEKTENIKNFIKEAWQLGLHKRDLKLELRGGITLDFPAYLDGLCKRYKLNV